jgi:hypothetical protein
VPMSRMSSPAGAHEARAAAVDEDEEDDRLLELLAPGEPSLRGAARVWAAVKTSVACVTLLPLRTVLLLCWLLLMSVVCLVATLLGGCGCCGGTRSGGGGGLTVRPRTGPQRAVLWLLSPLCRLCLLTLGFYHIEEHRVEMDGKTPRLARPCWQCRPSREVAARHAAAAAVASAVASSSGSRHRPGASVPSPIKAAASGDRYDGNDSGGGSHTARNEGGAGKRRMRVDAWAAAAGATVLANHVSIADALYLAWRYPSTTVASDFFKMIPCFAAIGHSIGVLFVPNRSRSKPEPGVRSKPGATALVRAYQQAATGPLGRHLRRLVVFPEGTTTNGSQILALRTGAFVSGLPVQPVVLRYHWRRRNPACEFGAAAAAAAAAAAQRSPRTPVATASQRRQRPAQPPAHGAGRGR